MRKFIGCLGLLIVIVIGAGVLFMYYAYSPIPHLTETHYVTVNPGDTVYSLSDRLASQGTEERKKLFFWAARAFGMGLHLKAGTYAIEPGMSPKQIFDLLSSGKTVAKRITIPEGFTIQQIDFLLAKEGFIQLGDFQKVASDPELIALMMVPGDTLEGYLFPDTYFWGGPFQASSFAKTLLDQFNDVWIPEYSKRAAEIGMTRHQILTLASIIEKETGRPEERRLVSSVFHNRLRCGMPLQADPTVIYGVEGYTGKITKKHLQTPTPYNTYIIPALPPGPICNPGKAAIYAALYPEETNYLYFVAKDDGTHVFTSTYRAHFQNVNRYQR